MVRPRRNLPRLEPKPSDSPATLDNQPGPSRLLGVELPRKRQAVASACNNCRKKRVKCDAVRPKCGPCVKADLECISTPKALSSRQADKQQVSIYRSVLELIRKGTSQEAAQALEAIREASDVDDAANSIAAASLLLSAGPPSAADAGKNKDTSYAAATPSIQWQKRRLTSPYDDSDFMFEKQYVVRSADQYVVHDAFVDVSTRKLPLSRWTSVSTDDREMNHLLTLFFTWDNIVERAIYRPIFEEDVIGEDPLLGHCQPRSFCSRFLVNALLATSCLYTLNPVTFKDANDSNTRGRLWADEAETLLQCIQEPSIPLLQGIYALFVYEGNIGNGTKSVQYFRRSMDTYKALNSFNGWPEDVNIDASRLQREREAASWCMWGFYCCEWRSSQAFGFKKLASKPKLDRLWRDESFPLSNPDCIGYWWFPYPMSLKAQRSMQVEVREVDVQLSEIVEDALNFLYPEQGHLPPIVQPGRAMELYEAFVKWRLACPSRIRFEEAVLPSTILLHVGVEVMLSAVMRPFTHMSKELFGHFDPRDRCLSHASSLMSTIWAFRAYSPVRFEYWLVHALGTAAYIVLADSRSAPMHMDVLVRACHCLNEMRVSLPLAADVLSGIRAAFKRCNVEVPAYMHGYFEAARHRKDGLMHHAAIALLPSSTDEGRIGSEAELQLQELLDEFGDIFIN